MPQSSVSTDLAFNALIESLYASLWDSQGMEKSLVTLRQHFNSCSATLMALQKTPRHMKYGWTIGVPEQYERWYIENDMVSKDPSVDLFETESPKTQGFIAASNMLGGLALLDVVSDDFKPWLSSEAIVDTAGLLIPSIENEFLILALQRNDNAGPFSELELQQLNLLAPHIKQAVQLFIKFYRQQSENSSLQAAINTLAQPTIIMDELLQVRYINQAAETLLARNDALAVVGEQIQIRQQDTHHQFMFQAWELVARRTADLAKGFNITMILPNSSGSQLSLTISPMFDHQAPGKSRGLLLQLFDPATHQLPSAERIQEIFHLTPAEATVCLMLAEGKTLQEIADTRHSSIHTVREQLRRVYKKTHYKRQSELVAAILRID